MSLILKAVATAEALKVLQYPFPVKAVQGTIKVNGEEVRAAQTSGRGKSYTYFTVGGVDYYVPGTVAFGTEHTIDFPADYQAKTLKVIRAVVYKGPKKAKEPKAEGDTGAAAPVGAASAPPPFTGGKKAKRGEASAQA